MNIIVNSLFKRVYQKLTGVYYNVSYAQTGEDLIIEFFIAARKISGFNYLDIGANHPVRLNNTYKFYEKGFHGVCVEPDPYLFGTLQKKRKRDICLNVGIAAHASGESDFFIMTNPVLNTFSRTGAMSMETNKQCTIKEVIKMPLKTIDEIIKLHFHGVSPVFINLDVEGLDEEILRTFPFHKYRPKIFCLETVEFTSDASSKKNVGIFKIMEANGYRQFADTYVNTIFVDTNV